MDKTTQFYFLTNDVIVIVSNSSAQKLTMPNKMKTFFTLVFFFFVNRVSSFDSPNRFTKSLSPNLLRGKSSKPQQYFELALPLPSDRLTPTCTHPILRHSFANTINGPPFSTSYSPPSKCPSPPWAAVAVEFRAKCRGEQYDRISALWLGGVEILRTSTAQPTKSGIFWKLRKDVTRYSSVLSRSDQTLTVMLENVVDAEFTGVYHVEVDLLFYNETLTLAAAGEPRWNEIPADLIIPVSDSGERGFWFRSESELDSKSAAVRFPRNTRRAVLELCVSFHGNDEFWYSNPPNSYVASNGLKTERANGAYREVFATIDGELVGAEVPFPVIFTGGINPLFWEPMVAIGAFVLPSYDVEATPFLGKVLDGKSHKIGIGVSEGISYWLVNANLHLWLDSRTPSVHAKSRSEISSALTVERESTFKKLDGILKVKAERRVRSAGWVKWSEGNHTTWFTQHYKVKNTIRFRNGGTHKTVEHKLSVEKDLRVQNDREQVVFRERIRQSFPLRVVTLRLMEPKKKKEALDHYVMVTNVSNSLKGKAYSSSAGARRFFSGQLSGGWMEVKGHSVVSGGAETKHTLHYKDLGGCYSATVHASNGKVLINDSSFLCSSLPLISSS